MISKMYEYDPGIDLYHGEGMPEKYEITFMKLGHHIFRQHYFQTVEKLNRTSTRMIQTWCN